MLTYRLPMTNIPFLIQIISDSQFTWNYLRDKETFFQFVAAFSKSILKFEHFRKKDDPHSLCISEITDPKNVVKQIFETSPFREPFDKQHAKREQTLSKSERHYLYHIYWSLWRKLSWKKSGFVITKSLRLFPYTLTAIDKYSLLDRDNLRQPIQMQLSQK